jgi:hypothetical protein
MHVEWPRERKPFELIAAGRHHLVGARGALHLRRTDLHLSLRTYMEEDACLSRTRPLIGGMGRDNMPYHSKAGCGKAYSRLLRRLDANWIRMAGVSARGSSYSGKTKV